MRDPVSQIHRKGPARRADRAIVASWRELLGRYRPYAIDAGLAVVVAAANAIAISEAGYPGTRPPDAFAYALGVVIGAFLLARRRWPAGVLVASYVTLMVYYWSNYPGIWPAVPLAVALYTAAAAGRLRWSLGIAGLQLVGQVFFVFIWNPEPLVAGLDGWVRDGSLLVAVLLFGYAVRTHRALMAEASERVRRAEEDREREAREMSAARVIQRQLLPEELPALPGWRLAAHYRPAREVGGDFYDLRELPDGRIAIVAGDVSGKGIPAALVMASTHAVLRDASDLASPGEVLARANDRLYPDVPSHTFATCLYAVLDPSTGRLRFANAGHNLPFAATGGGVEELRARGMPLGAMPGMTYEEREVLLAPGDRVLFHSDGLVEAHDASGEMFGSARLRKVVSGGAEGERLIDECLAGLGAFVGGGWEQEDDITLVTLQRDGR